MSLLSIPRAYSEVELLQLVATGDEAAFREFFHLYRNKLYAFIFRYAKSAHVTEELVQDVFMKFWAGRDALARIDNPGSYIFTIARNRCIDHLRKLAGETAMLEKVWKHISDRQNSTEEALDLNEVRRLIDASLTLLSPRKRTAFQLSRYEGLSNRQVAEKMGLSEGTVKNMISDSLKHVRAYLEQHNVSLGIAFAVVFSRL